MSSRFATFWRLLRMCWPGHAERIAGSGAWNTLWWLDGILLYAREAERFGRSPWSWSRRRRLAEEHTTVHVYNLLPLEATRVILSPPSRTCTHIVLKQIPWPGPLLYIAGCRSTWRSRRQGDFGGWKSKPRWTMAEIYPLSTSCPPVGSSTSVETQIHQPLSFDGQAQLKCIPAMLARRTPPARNIICMPHSELPPTVRDKGKQHEQRGACMQMLLHADRMMTPTAAEIY